MLRGTGLAAILPEHSVSLVAHLIEKKNMSNKSLGKCVYCGNDLFSESIHKCNNTMTAQPKEPEQELVAFIHECRKKPELKVLSFKQNEPELSAKGYKATPLVYPTPPQRKPLDFGDFFEWANDEGYDTAHTHDGVKWVCLNPMTADLWKTWQAAHGIKGEV